jgi:hypothetical protein
METRATQEKSSGEVTNQTNHGIQLLEMKYLMEATTGNSRELKLGKATIYFKTLEELMTKPAK